MVKELADNLLKAAGGVAALAICAKFIVVRVGMAGGAVRERKITIMRAHPYVFFLADLLAAGEGDRLHRMAFRAIGLKMLSR